MRVLLMALAVIAAACTAPTPPQTFEPVSQYETAPPEITKWMQEPSILVYSKTLGWRHNEGIAGADKFFVELARERGYGIFTTVNGAVFNAKDLSRFDVIVFNNVTGDTLSEAQRSAFQTWLENGGAWIGLHGAGDYTHQTWPWYAKTLIGPHFLGHPQTPHFNKVRVETLLPDHPIMTGLPKVWSHDDEWYFFDSNPADYDLIPLAGIYEADFKPKGDDVAKLKEWAMGPTPADHPVIWVRCLEQGRAFFSALGHSDLAYDVPENRLLLGGAFDWVTMKTDPSGEGCLGG